MRTVSLAATQMACVEDAKTNVDLAEQQVREAGSKGAQIILLQELFETPYFCKDMNTQYFALAHEGADNPLIQRFQGVTVLPCAIKAVPTFSPAMILASVPG